MKRTQRQHIKRDPLSVFLAQLLGFLMLIIILFPVYWIIINAFKTNVDIYEVPPQLVPNNIILDNFITAIKDSNCLVSLWNSVFCSSCTMILTVTVTVLSAYAVTRLEFNGKKLYYVIIASTQVFPIVVSIVPLYLLFRKLGLYNTRISLILSYTAMCIPIAFTLLIGYFNDLPKELEEAALIDGCNRIQSLYYVLIPIAKSGIVATGIYVFLTCWQEYLVAVSLISDQAKYTLTICLTMFQSVHSVNWGATMAVSVVIAAPAIVLFFFIEKFFVESLAGAVKG